MVVSRSRALASDRSRLGWSRRRMIGVVSQDQVKGLLVGVSKLTRPACQYNYDSLCPPRAALQRGCQVCVREEASPVLLQRRPAVYRCRETTVFPCGSGVDARRSVLQVSPRESSTSAAGLSSPARGPGSLKELSRRRTARQPGDSPPRAFPPEHGPDCPPCQIQRLGAGRPKSPVGRERNVDLIRPGVEVLGSVSLIGPDGRRGKLAVAPSIALSVRMGDDSSFSSIENGTHGRQGRDS